MGALFKQKTVKFADIPNTVNALKNCGVAVYAAALKAYDTLYDMEFPSLKNEDGTFKILNISDIQDQANLLTITADFMKAAIEAEQPDLIIAHFLTFSLGVLSKS